MMNNDIILILKSNKETCSIGDDIEFTYTFFNNSSESIYVLPWGGHYSTSWIVAYDIKGKKLQDLPLVVYELELVPSKEDFILIEPKQSHSICIQGKIVKTTLSKFGSRNQKKYKGFFINFENSAIYLERPGTFNLKATYQGMEDWSKKAKELYSLDNIFIGSLESKELKIIIH